MGETVASVMRAEVWFPPILFSWVERTVYLSLMESLLKRSSIMCAGMIAFMVSSTAFTILSLIKSSFIRIETFLCAGGLTSRVCMFFFCSSLNVLICSSGIMVYPPFLSTIL